MVLGPHSPQSLEERGFDLGRTVEDMVQFAANVLERAAFSLKCIGGTFGGNQQPTKFLCLTLKLLQLQPEDEDLKLSPSRRR
jgi:hypothetical protein